MHGHDCILITGDNLMHESQRPIQTRIHLLYGVPFR